MRALTAEAITTAAITTTTTPDAIGEVDFMVGPTVDGVQGLAGVGAGAERPGTVTTGIISTRIPSMQLQRFGSLTT